MHKNRSAIHVHLYLCELLQLSAAIEQWVEQTAAISKLFQKQKQECHMQTLDFLEYYLTQGKWYTVSQMLTLMAFMNFWASFSPPLILKDTIPPYPLHTLVASSCWGWEGRPTWRKLSKIPIARWLQDGPTRIDGLCDVGWGAEELCDGLGVPLMLSHAQMKSLESSVGQVAIEWTGHHTYSYNYTEHADTQNKIPSADVNEGMQKQRKITLKLEVLLRSVFSWVSNSEQ